MTVLDKHEVILDVLTDEFQTTTQIKNAVRKVHGVEAKYNEMFELYMAGKCTRGTVFEGDRELFAFKK